MTSTSRSMKSVKSIRPDGKTSKADKSVYDNEDTLDIADSIIEAATKFECPVHVAVIKYTVEEYGSRSKKDMKNAKTLVPMNGKHDSDECSQDTFLPEEVYHSLLIINAVLDHNRVVGISMLNYRFTRIPRLVMLILSVILPMFKNLTKFIISDCFIDMYTIHELSHIVEATKITEVYLDSTFLPEGNYYELLQHTSALQHLSLSRCSINDKVCKEIMSLLHYSQPGETLTILNLSSNLITDVGAKTIGEMLRTNRHLRHLNLAGNQITDEGALYIFDTLKLFRLSGEDVSNVQSICRKYLLNKIAILNKCKEKFGFSNVGDMYIRAHRNKELEKRMSNSSLKKASIKQKRQPIHTNNDEESHSAKIELMAYELLGPFEHPYDRAHVVTRDCCTSCKGNFILCYLNMAYNQLMFPSLQRLLTVLKYQESYRSEKMCGLMRVVVDGNNLPETSTVMNQITTIINKRVFRNDTLTPARRGASMVRGRKSELHRIP